MDPETPPHLLKRDFHDDLVGVYLPSGVHPSNLGVVPPDLEPRKPGSVLQQPALERDHLRGGQGICAFARVSVLIASTALQKRLDNEKTPVLEHRP